MPNEKHDSFIETESAGETYLKFNLHLRYYSIFTMYCNI